MSFSHYCRKNGSVVFLILCQNVELNSVIQPAKTICEKKNFVQKSIQVKDALRLIIERPLLYILYLAQK